MSAFINFVVISDVLMVDTERMSFRVELPLSEEIQFLVNEAWDRLNSHGRPPGFRQIDDRYIIWQFILDVLRSLTQLPKP